MSTALAIYSALGVTMGAFLMRGYYSGRLRWYNVAAGAVIRPALVVHVVRVAVAEVRRTREGRR